MGIQTRIDYSMPWELFVLSGCRSYHINPNDHTELKWSFIHALALQTINKQFWRKRFDNIEYNGTTLWWEFTGRLRSNIIKLDKRAQLLDNRKSMSIIRGTKSQAVADEEDWDKETFDKTFMNTDAIYRINNRIKFKENLFIIN